MLDLVPVAVLLAVCIVITFREKIKIIAPWQAMALGALTVLAAGFPISSAISSIDFGVIIFLYSMFVLASLLVESNYLNHLGYKVLRHFYNPFFILLAFVFAAGAGSAFFLNDTVAIIGVPLSIAIAKISDISARPLLVALALAVTIGSVASPIGNPQNFIIASQHAFTEPFTDFAKYLLVPAVISLIALAALLWHFFPELKKLKTIEKDVKEKKNDYWAARAGFQIVIALSFLRAFGVATGLLNPFGLYWIPIAGAAASVLLSKNPKNLLKTDYKTLVFFACMFVLMASVWETGFFQKFLPDAGILSRPVPIIAGSLILSQFLSNVPFVILYVRALGNIANVKILILLAAGSTLAGGITFLGAASNIIIMQTAEKYKEQLPLKEFTIIGIASVIISVLVLFGWLNFL